MTEQEYLDAKEKMDLYGSYKAKVNKVDDVINNFTRFVQVSFEHKNGKNFFLDITDDIRSELMTVLENYKTKLVTQMNNIVIKDSNSSTASTAS